jgi:hypothetical protein
MRDRLRANAPSTRYEAPEAITAREVPFPFDSHVMRFYY